MVAAFGVDEDPSNHCFSSKKHPISHRITVGQGEFNGTLLSSQSKLFTNDVAGLFDAASTAYASLIPDFGFMADDDRTLML